MWLAIGLIAGFGLLWLISTMKTQNITLKWYEWLIGIIALALLFFTIQNFTGSFTELESKAAYMFLLVTGLPSLILFAIVWQLAARRAKKT